jgi:hypothetical protein
MQTIQRVLQEKRQEILLLAEKHRATNVRVFGSVARSDNRLDSDVDFLVEFAPESNLLDQIAFKQDMERLLERPVDVVGEDSIYWLLRRRILREARPL